MKIKINDDYVLDIEPKKSITITRVGYAPNTFVIGDVAEYDSFNLSYTGIIRQITEKTVTIEAYPNTSNAKKHRLKLDTFAWRNYRFNAERVAFENAQTMYYI